MRDRGKRRVRGMIVSGIRRKKFGVFIPLTFIPLTVARFEVRTDASKLL
jgi:hypothetical protein